MPSFFAYKTRDYPGYVVEDYFYGTGGDAAIPDNEAGLGDGDDGVISNLNSMVFPSQTGDDSPELKANNRLSNQPKKF